MSKSSRTSEFKLDAFSDIGFLYSVSERDIDKYYEEEIKRFKRSLASLKSLVCKNSRLVAYRDANHFPDDIISMAEKKFPESTHQQEKYEFAVAQLKAQIDSLQNELSNPENTALVTRYINAQAECLKWFNHPTVDRKSYTSPGWNSYNELWKSFNRMGRAGIVQYFLQKIKDIHRCWSEPLKEAMVREADKQYQKVLKSLKGSVCKISDPNASNESSSNHDSKEQDSSTRGLEAFLHCLKEKLRNR